MPVENQPDDVPVKLSSDLWEHLNQRQSLLLQSKFENFYEWMISRGKEPEEEEGLAVKTADNYLNRVDQCFRIGWRLRGEITLSLSQEMADDICQGLKRDKIVISNGEPYSESSKKKFSLSLGKWFDWAADQRDAENWQSPYSFNEVASRPADYFTRQERRLLREEALQFDTLPAYSDCSPKQRSRIKQHLSQKLGKPKSELTVEDWKQQNRSWEKPSLIWTSLDAALRPVEVSRAAVQWVRPDKATLIIPKQDACKNRENWEVALKTETAEIVGRWLKEREHLEKYQDRNELWLTRESNPWSSSSLNNLLRRLCDEASIDRTNRRITWYSIRHSVGQHMTEMGGIDEAKAQLRHKSIESTLRYTDPTAETRRSTLDKMD